MNVEQAIVERQSVRAFLPKPVPRATLEKILTVATRAPSGSNIQPWKAIVLQGAALFGVYGLGLLTFLVLAAPVAGTRAALAALALVAVGVAAGYAILPDGPVATEGRPLVRIVQPNVSQADKWRPEMRARQLSRLVDMSRQAGFDRLAAVVLVVPYDAGASPKSTPLPTKIVKIVSPVV